MIPTNNNNNKGCNPISSNCVIWQGPDIDCGSNFKICNGDTVSDVVANLAAELCGIASNPVLSIDPKCFSEILGSSYNLNDVLNALIEKACETPATPSTPGETLMIYLHV